MTEAALRSILVGSIGLVAVAFGWYSSRRVRRSHEKGTLVDPAAFDGMEEPVFLFTTDSCSSCDEARRRLVAAGAEFREIAYRDAPHLHAAAGVTGVPLILARTVDGGISDRIAGQPAFRRLKRLLERAGSE